MTSVKRDRPRDSRSHDDLRAARAADEAAELLDQMRADLAAVTAFVDAQHDELVISAPSTKRLARLRLMHEDLRSARGFATKPYKR